MFNKMQGNVISGCNVIWALYFRIRIDTAKLCFVAINESQVECGFLKFQRVDFGNM